MNAKYLLHYLYETHLIDSDNYRSIKPHNAAFKFKN